MVIRSFAMADTENIVTNQGRAGNYVTQIGGYKAFVPKSLPPNPPLHLDSEMIQLLSQADRELGRLDGQSDMLPNAHLFFPLSLNNDPLLSPQFKETPPSL